MLVGDNTNKGRIEPAPTRLPAVAGRTGGKAGTLRKEKIANSNQNRISTLQWFKAHEELTQLEYLALYKYNIFKYVL